MTTRISYYNNISMMMYGFGDSHEPNPDTVRLVESIVLQQLCMIVKEAKKYGNGEEIKGEDLIFLLRHNKYKMQRFVRYFCNKDLSKKYKSMKGVALKASDVEERGRRDLIEFVERIDETGEFMDTSEVDEVKLERMLRADRIAQDLDEKKYLQFHKARCASFKVTGLGHEAIRNWLNPEEQFKFKTEALEVLSYFAFQTVADITDYALMVREDTRAGIDPLKHLPGSYYTATMFNGAHRFEGDKPDYTRVRSAQTPISVDEVKEVMRRLYSPQAGRLNFGGKVPDTHYIFAL